MKYFKHQANMRHDTKIRLLVNRYGLEGYGLYNLILESIVEGLDDSHPVPELKETCEEIAALYHGNTANINEQVSWMINAGLFSISEFSARVMCVKIFKFLDAESTRSEKVRNLVRNFKAEEKRQYLSATKPDVSEVVSDIFGQNLPETETETETETELVSVDASPPTVRQKFVKPTIEEVRDYCQERGKGVNPESWMDHYTANGWRVGKNPMKDWRAAVRQWERSSFGPQAGADSMTEEQRNARIAEILGGSR